MIDNQAEINVYSSLLKERKIFINGYIDEDMSNSVISKLLLLEYDDKTKDIELYINSGGGIVQCGFAIYDMIKIISPDVSTICIGNACSMAAIILGGGTKGKRFSLPTSKIMIHQPRGSTCSATSSEIEIYSYELQKSKKDFIKCISSDTGQVLDKVKKDIEKDYYMTSSEAINYGLIDAILRKR